MNQWRVAASLLKLRDQIDANWPKRDKSSDGTIGDAAHASRKSDHNPWVIDRKGMPVVTALDITYDLMHGVDCHDLVSDIVASKDRRVKYIIWNRQIFSPPRWKPRPYKGANPHTKHMHVSVFQDQDLYDDKRAWIIIGSVIDA